MLYTLNLHKEVMAIHSSILAFENPHGQKNLSGLEFIGLRESDTTEVSTYMCQLYLNKTGKK